MEQPDFMSGEEDIPRTQREKRLALAREKQMVRSALMSAARHGYYVFDELITDDAGIIDFFAVGPLTACAVLVRSDRGYISWDKGRNKLLIDGRDFEDDPHQQASGLVDDVDRKVFGNDYSIRFLICFMNTEFEVDENRLPPYATTPVWELPWALDPEGEENLNRARIEEIVEKVQEVYGRPPIIRPEMAGEEL